MIKVSSWVDDRYVVGQGDVPHDFWECFQAHKTVFSHTGSQSIISEYAGLTTLKSSNFYSICTLMYLQCA